MAATIAPMPTWRCPHCGTPQTETARCWVCRRSSTACGTCRHFRRSVAAQLGYCGLDRRRAPLAGDEIRACWEPAPVVSAALSMSTAPPTPRIDGARTEHREFVEVEPATKRPGVTSGPAAVGRPGPATSPTEPAELETPAATVRPALEPGWNLWGDLEA